MNNPFIPDNNLSRPLLLDGAMGSYLQQKEFQTDDTIWTTIINHSHPEAVMQIHKEYIEAGANIITTNTFRTNPSSLHKKGYSDVSHFVMQAVDIARQSIDDKKIFIAGSNPPAEDCYQVKRNLSYNELEMNHCKHIDLLVDNRVDFILNETQSHFDEIKIICNHCDQNNIAYLISIYLTEDHKLLSGESVENILTFLSYHNPIGIGFNCISYKTLNGILGSTVLPANWGFYLNCCNGQPADQLFSCGITPEEYSNHVKKSLSHNPVFVGSCCGSTPEHTKRIRKLLEIEYDS